MFLVSIGWLIPIFLAAREKCNSSANAIADYISRVSLRTINVSRVSQQGQTSEQIDGEPTLEWVAAPSDASKLDALRPDTTRGD
jgi:hypothetical protein